MKKKSLNAKKRILNRSTFNLNQKFIKKIYKKFDKNINGIDRSLVAVSGGPDSLSLAFLAKCYSDINSAKFSYVVIDHKLRKESSFEAKKVVQLLKKIGIRCKILVWKGKKPKSNIQKIARNNRYDLLLKESNRLKIKTILLGHQMNDLHENFFIRMIRGSGLKGLVSLGKNSELSNIKLIRPLIDIDKRNLEKIALKVFKTFVNDPSNLNDHFTRVRIRKILKEFQKEGLENQKINLTIKNLKSANDALDFYTKKNILKNTIYDKKKNFYFIKKEFFGNPEDILIRSIGIILQKISGRYYAPRGKKIKRLMTLMSSQKKALKTTLSGCVLKKVNETVIIYKE